MGNFAGWKCKPELDYPVWSWTDMMEVLDLETVVDLVGIVPWNDAQEDSTGSAAKTEAVSRCAEEVQSSLEEVCPGRRVETGASDAVAPVVYVDTRSRRVPLQEEVEEASAAVLLLRKPRHLNPREAAERPYNWTAEG